MVIKGIIFNKNETEALDMINLFINENNQRLSNTFHEFESNLPSHLINSINIIKEGTIKYQILLNNNNNNNIGVFCAGSQSEPEQNHHSTQGFAKQNWCCNMKVGILPISEMNELYISSIGAGGSDKVFETDHLDGPFFFLPFCKVYRCIACINANSSIYTSFPITGEKYFLQKNEFLAFDYNRDVHSICQDSTIKDDSSRILLKLHYIVYPTYLPMFVVHFYKNLHVKYNNFMRYMFIHSQIPGKESEHSLTSKESERSLTSKESDIYDETVFECYVNKIYDIYRSKSIIKNGLAYGINFGTVVYCRMFSIVSKLFLVRGLKASKY